MNTRIKELRKALGLSQKDFASELGYQQSSLSDIEKSRAIVTDRIIIAVCSKFHVNEEWLRYGKGEMFINIDRQYDEFFTIYNDLIPELQDFLVRMAKDLLNTQDKI